MSKMKKRPYQLYVEKNMKRIGGKNKFIKECERVIRNLSDYPKDNIHQLIWWCGVIRYLKSIK